MQFSVVEYRQIHDRHARHVFCTRGDVIDHVACGSMKSHVEYGVTMFVLAVQLTADYRTDKTVEEP